MMLRLKQVSTRTRRLACRFRLNSSNAKSLRELALAGDFESSSCGNYMPSSSRESFYVLRAINIEISGVRDAARGNLLAARIRLQFFRDLISAVYSGTPHSHPLYQPLSVAVKRHDLNRRWLERLVDAREKALDGPPPKSIADMELYAEETVSSLLFLSLESCGIRDDRADEAASYIGRATGLATSLRVLPLRLSAMAYVALGLERPLPGYAVEYHGLPADVMRKVELTNADLLGLALSLGLKPNEQLCIKHSSAAGSEADMVRRRSSSAFV